MDLNQLLTLSKSLNELKNLWLVFDDELNDILIETQKKYGDGRNFAQSIKLIDGRWTLCADLLTEIGEGGWAKNSFTELPKEKFNQIEVFSNIQELISVN